MTANNYKKQDFANNNEVRWCPGCGDYAILAALQRVLPELDIAPEKHVFVSGIGCAGRLPYYMNTYGFHTIHGRATAVATGLKMMRDDLSVWVITGDGDALSIGASHLLHCLRRNVNINILLFNNEVYGLTKGQYSPTSKIGQITKTSPLGVGCEPLNPLVTALAAGASFVARAVDKDPKHLAEILKQAHAHQGASFIEIYQDCNIFNHGAFDAFAVKTAREKNTIQLSSDVHNSEDFMAAMQLARQSFPEHPVALGVYYQVNKPIFQTNSASIKKTTEDAQQLLYGSSSWEQK